MKDCPKASLLKELQANNMIQKKSTMEVHDDPTPSSPNSKYNIQTKISGKFFGREEGKL